MKYRAIMKTKPAPDTTSPAINRRDFIARSALSALALALPAAVHSRPRGQNALAALFKDARMGIVVHSYATRWNPKLASAKYPGFADAVDLLRHSHKIGASGIQVGVNNWTADFARKIKAEKEKLGLYLEGSIGMPFSREDVDAFDKNIAAAKTAGVDIIRTVCTAGRRYEVYHSPIAFQTAHSKALAALQLGEPVLRKHRVKLGVENHKDWRADELADMIKKMSSEWIGVTLDFGNSIALMEDPMEVVNTLAPFAVTTHVKDMGLDEYADGVLLSEVPLGTGILDLNAIVATCKKHNPAVTFNLEMITRDPLQVPCLTDEYWATFGGVPGGDLARTLRLTRKHKTGDGLPHVSQLSTDERLEAEEKNILDSLTYSATNMGLK
jgi:sugar phosphate isomerase/epimerase